MLVRANFPDRLSQEITVTIDELRGLLICTRQNVKLLLHKWSEQGAGTIPGFGSTVSSGSTSWSLPSSKFAAGKSRQHMIS